MLMLSEVPCLLIQCERDTGFALASFLSFVRLVKVKHLFLYVTIATRAVPYVILRRFDGVTDV